MIEVWRDRGSSNLEYFREVLAAEGLGDLLDLVSYPRTCFGVVRRPDGLRSAVLIDQAWNPQAAYRFSNYAYAVYEEHQADWAAQPRRCPRRILEQLDPVEQLYPDEHLAREVRGWREGVRVRLEQLDARPLPRKGQLVRFPHTIHFRDGSSCRELLYLGRGRFGAPGADWSCRIHGWRELQYQVLDHTPRPSALEELLR